MKKLLMLSIVGIMSLSSFGTKETKKEVVKMSYWKIYCNGVDSGSGFWCDGCSQGSANIIAGHAGVC